MSRLWIGVGLLAVLLAFGVGMFWISRSFCESFSLNLEQAEKMAVQGDWDAAARNAEKSIGKWRQYHRFWAAFTDHEPMEEMEALLTELELYRWKKLAYDYAAVCRKIRDLAQAIHEAHGLTWWSIL